MGTVFIQWQYIGAVQISQRINKKLYSEILQKRDNLIYHKSKRSIMANEKDT